MTWTLSMMLTRMMASRFGLILAGITIFVLTLDVATYAPDILALHNDELSSIAKYALLRLPGVASAFVGIAALLALLLMLTELSHRSELVAIWNTGISQLRLILIIAPVALAIGVFHFLVDDQAVPGAAPTLHKWGIGDYSGKKLKVGEDDPIWLRSGNDILRAAKSNPNATKLSNVTIFRRDAAGILTEQIIAKSAEQVSGRWELADVVIYYRENLPPSRVNRMIYSGLLRPAAVGTRSGDPEEMSSADLQYFIANAGFGIRPPHVYSTWQQKRITLFFVSFLMVLIAVPLSVQYRRGGGLGRFFAIGVGLGFAYFIFEGVSLTMGELGLVPPWMAAWMPMMVFGATATAIAISQESL
ncbi:MAG: YjgP/YjgQ family permease [Alphaproteobacteria bacterium]|nr:YjgP/YjgQ family permease [Alphaproteobacteria bacterium]